MGLNGKEIGRHEGGFTPFNFEVTELLADGGNTIIVKVNNRRREDGVPGLAYDWWNYGGLTREVYLIEVPTIFVRDYEIHLEPDRRTVSGWVTRCLPSMHGTQSSGLSRSIKTSLWVPSPTECETTPSDSRTSR